MSHINDEELNNSETWSWIIPVKTRLNLHCEINNEENIESRSEHERINCEDSIRQEKVLLSTSIEDEIQESKEDYNVIQRILSYIDQRRPPHQKKFHLNWRTFLGTMSQMEQIYNQDNFVRNYKKLRWLLIYFDSVFRGIGQVMFANNPLSGLIITIGLFIGNWELTFYGLLGTCVSTLTAFIFDFDMNAIRAGLFGYNGCLASMGITYFTYSNSPQMIGPVIIMSIFSSIFLSAIRKILVQRLGIPPFTFSFQVCTWIWLLGALKYRYFLLDGTIISPSLLTTLTTKPLISNISIPNYTVEDNFVGFFTSISQVYFIENPYTGAIILIGVCICSRILSFFALFGSVTSQLSAAYLLGLSPKSIHAGLWGYNSVLTCQALGGMFFILSGYEIWLLILYGSLMTVIVQASVSSFLNTCGMPTLTFPFTFICWIFCLIAGTKNLITVKLTSISIPEDHRRRFQISQLIKSKFKFVYNLKNFSLSSNEDITSEQLFKLENLFIPLLMCLYTYQNDFKNFQNLIKKNVNINLTDKNNRSPLHISVSQGNIKITKYLIETCKINVNLIDKYDGTPLFDALWNGHFHLLPYLYSHGARLPSSKSKELAFYLNAFVYEGYFEGIQCFISCGFNPNGTDADGRNALHIAVITNQFEIVSYLIEHFPVWLDICDYYHQTAIDYALRLSHLNIANYLLDKKKTNPIPLDFSIDNKTTFIENNHEQEQENLINNEQNILSIIFNIIAGDEDIQLMDKFLKENSNFNPIECVDYDYRSAAHVAASEGRIETIRFLSEQCSNEDFQRIMNREDRWGLSPLDEAYRNGHKHICQFVNQNRSETTFSTQINIQTNSTVHFLRKWKKIYIFSTLAASGAAQRIETLFLRHYFIPTEIYADYHGRTPCHFAAANGHLNVIQVLIRYQYQGITHINRWGYLPIHEARQKKYYKIVEQLMQFH